MATSTEVTVELESTDESTQPTLRDPIPFNPPTSTRNDPLPNFRSNNIPRYLFRVFTPNSCGETTDAYVRPLSTTTLAPESAYLDIFEAFNRGRRHLAAEHVRRHLQWECWPGKEEAEDCNFVSWSSSLLFVLQYALHRMEVYDRLQHSRGEVKFLLLDTTKFRPGTFISELDLINFFVPHEKYYGVKSLRNLRKLREDWKGYYFGEYLSQGDLEIKGACVQTDLQELINCGLFTLLPELKKEEQWKKMNKGGVFKLRETLQLDLVHNDSDDRAASNPATRDEVIQAIDLGKLFSSESLDFTVPAAAMFLSLRKRTKEDPVILKVFEEEFSAAQIERIRLGETKVPIERWIPEVLQFKMIIEDIQRHFTSQQDQRRQEDTQGDSTDLLTDGLAGLSI